MKKHTLTVLVALLITATSFGQTQKPTDTLIIKIDTTTYKRVLSLIQENINGNSETGKMLLFNIIYPLRNISFLQPADKPKEVPKK